MTTHYPVCPSPPEHVPDGYIWVGICDPGPEPWWQIVITVFVVLVALALVVLIGGRR